MINWRDNWNFAVGGFGATFIVVDMPLYQAFLWAMYFLFIAAFVDVAVQLLRRLITGGNGSD